MITRPEVGFGQVRPVNLEINYVPRASTTSTSTTSSTSTTLSTSTTASTSTTTTSTTPTSTTTASTTYASSTSKSTTTTPTSSTIRLSKGTGQDSSVTVVVAEQEQVSGSFPSPGSPSAPGSLPSPGSTSTLLPALYPVGTAPRITFSTPIAAVPVPTQYSNPNSDRPVVLNPVRSSVSNFNRPTVSNPPRPIAPTPAPGKLSTLSAHPVVPQSAPYLVSTHSARPAVPNLSQGAVSNLSPRPVVPTPVSQHTLGDKTFSDREDRFQTNFKNPQPLPGQIYRRTGQVYPSGQGFRQVPGQIYRGGYYRTTESPGFIESIGQSALDLTKGFFSWPF